MKLEQLAQIATGRADDTAVIPAELSGYAAQAAVQVLIKNWEVALQEGWPHNLVADIDNVVAVLRDVQQKAREQLPLENGGLAGKSVEAWKALQGAPQVLEALAKIEAFRNLNKQLDAVISSEKALKEKKAKGEKLTKAEEKEQKENQSWRKELRENLLKFITRIPVFMYLTDEREVGLKDVIENIEPALFTRVTGLSIENFRTLCELNVFHSGNLNSAIFAFKNYEEGSLSYAGNSKVTEVVGGWDTTLTREEAIELVKGV